MQLHPTDLLLFAVDVETIIQIAVVLFIAISSLAGHFFKPKPPQPQKKRPPRPPVKAAEAVRDEPVTAQLERQRLEEEIDAMLRKATGQPPERPRPAPPQPAIEATVVPAEPLVVRGESVAEHVSKHITSGGMGGLHSSLDRADERLENHLHQKFDHLLGNLRTTEGRSSLKPRIQQGTDAAMWREKAVDVPAERIAQMMRNPADLSTAIVLSEVLNRPEHHWD